MLNMRVHELANDLNISIQSAFDMFQAPGFDVKKSHIGDSSRSCRSSTKIKK